MKSEKISGMICPDEGTCSFEVFNNRTIIVKKDNLGAVYIEIANGNNAILKFEYKRQTHSRYVDGGYREEIFIELDSNILDGAQFNLADKKLYFARCCYCKGQTGYYKINNGTLQVNKLEQNTFNLHLDFKIDEVPQIINQISHTFNLK